MANHVSNAHLIGRYSFCHPSMSRDQIVEFLWITIETLVLISQPKWTGKIYNTTQTTVTDSSRIIDPKQSTN